MDTIDEAVAIREKTLKALKALEGDVWKEVQGELHVQNNEMPTWVLLYEDSDLEKAHDAFKRIVMPHFEVIHPIQFTVAYLKYEGDERVSVDDLFTNQEIASAPTLRALGKSPLRQRRPGPNIFTASDSRR